MAEPVEYRTGANPPMAMRIELGDGWGCAELHDRSRYCWEAPGDVEGGQTVLAHAVPWLDDSRTSAGPDRICRRDVDQVRCVRAPEFIRSRDPLSPGKKVSGPVDSWLVESAKDGGPLMDPTPATHGAFRGCRDELCWGPHDAPPSSPQLKLCHHQALAVPCAVAGETALREFWDSVASGNSMVGDLFGCFDSSRGVLCIGASRDGLFGTKEECPPALFKGWPTATGKVLAPNAKCSRAAALLRGGYPGSNEESASPRAVCFEEVARATARPFEPDPPPMPPPKQHCFGAIWVPEVPLLQLVLGLGDEPSACGIDTEHRVHCWGARYSERGRPTRRIEFVMPTLDGAAFGLPGTFLPSCAVHRNCARRAEPLPTCSANNSSHTVRAVLKDPESFEDQWVTVRGELGLSSWADQSLASDVCGAGTGISCCPRDSFAIVVRDATGQLFIDERRCAGDRSRTCCDTPAFGQPANVSGRLTWRRQFRTLGDAWVLAEATLCEVR